MKRNYMVPFIKELYGFYMATRRRRSSPTPPPKLKRPNTGVKIMGVVTKTEADATAQTSAHPVLIPSLHQSQSGQPNRLRKRVLALLASTAIVGVIGFAADYWTSGRFEISTDDAY